MQKVSCFWWLSCGRGSASDRPCVFSMFHVEHREHSRRGPAERIRKGPVERGIEAESVLGSERDVAPNQTASRGMGELLIDWLKVNVLGRYRTPAMYFAFCCRAFAVGASPYQASYFINVPRGTFRQSYAAALRGAVLWQACRLKMFHVEHQKEPAYFPQWKSAPFGYGKPELHFADTAYGVCRPGMKGLTLPSGDALQSLPFEKRRGSFPRCPEPACDP